ncbi:glycosyltransferase family 4 protein [Fodinibacter luteus]|uniref:glycosyltransferase family 4 protein n=1 Tax=Fodinibacter luteus TaxID=552064 RepID=UPI0031EE663F
MEVRNIAYLLPRTIPRADVVVATAVTTARVTAAACRRSGATGIYLIQSYEDWLADREVVDATWRLPLTNFVIADWLADKGAELGVGTVLVPNGIDLEAFPPGPPLAQRRNDVVALASDVPNKRTDLLVLALRRVAELRGGLSAVVFGTCARPDGLPESVEYVRSPSPDQLSGLYRSAKVYLCTSDAEGWHLPPAEAMSSATAVVSTEIGGVMTYARGVSATALAGDAASLAAQVVGLLDDPQRCQELASAGLDRIRHHDEASAARRFGDELEAAWRRDHCG